MTRPSAVKGIDVMAESLSNPGSDAPILGDVVVVLDEAYYQYQGRVFTPASWWLFAEYFAAYCRSLTLYVPMSQGEVPPANSMPVESASLKIVGRFQYTRMMQYHLRMPTCRLGVVRQARQIFAGCDLVIFRMPSPIAMSFAKIAWKLGKKTAVLVGGDLLKAGRHAGGRGIKKVLHNVVGGYERRKELRVSEGSVFVGAWGEEMFELFSRHNSNTAMAADANISESLIMPRTDTCDGPTVRIVRVGALNPNKGTNFLIEAVASLRSAGRDVRVDLVGAADAEGGYGQELQDLVNRLNLSDVVIFHGQQKFGPALFDIYRKADIQVVSSLGEGIPRCIAEGRVFGLPTIATRVGGIPTIVHDEQDGLLIDPGDVGQIAAAIGRMIDDSPLRRKIIANSCRLALTETGEFQARRLATLIARSLGNEPLTLAARDIHVI